MDLSLAGGGKLVIVGARRSNCPGYWDHPQCLFRSGEELVRRGLPSNTKAVVFTKWIGHAAFGGIMAEARKRHLTIFPVKGTGEINKIIHDFVEKEKKPVPVARPVPTATVMSTDALISTFVAQPPVESIVIMPKNPTPRAIAKIGQIQDLLSRHHQAEGRITEEADRLLEIAKKEEITTTRASLAQAVGQFRKTRTTKPKKAAAKSSPLLTLVDDAIASLSLIREELLKATDEKSELAEMKRQLSQMLGVKA